MNLQRVGLFWFLLTFVCYAVAQEQGAGGSGESGSSEIVAAAPPSAKEFDLKVKEGQVPKFTKYAKALARNGEGEQEVVKAMAMVDDDVVVIRPNGTLSVVNKSDIQQTDEKFARMGKSDVEAILADLKLKDYKISATKPYVFAHKCTASFYAHTESILTSMYPGVMQQLRNWGLKVHDPELPLVVIITPSREAFDEIKKMPDGVVAYYNVIKNVIVLYEDERLASAAPEFALKQAAYTIAHEGVHQILANTRIQHRLSDWPAFMSEGLPEYFCPLGVSQKVEKKSGDEIPVRTLKWTKAGKINDLRMRSLLRLRSDDGAAVRTVACGKIGQQLTATGYAMAWGMVHYLVKFEPEKFKAYLKELSEIEPLNMYVDDPDVHQKLFIKHFGEEWAILEIKVQKHLTSRQMQREYKDPIANQTRYIVKRTVKRGKLFDISAAISTSPQAAAEWKKKERIKHERAKFSTFICKSQQEANYRLRQILGR